MKLKTKILSAFLAILFLLSAISTSVVFEVSAAEDGGTTDATAVIDIEDEYLHKRKFKDPQEKLDSMVKVLEKHGYRLYVDDNTGEIAIQEIQNPENILFTNPYDIASYDDITINADVKKELLSQIVIRYRSATGDQKGYQYLYSFQDAALHDQIKRIKIRNGVRIEYVLGEEAARKLVPRALPAESFEKLIWAQIEEAYDSKGDWNAWNIIKNYYKGLTLNKELVRNGDDAPTVETPSPEELEDFPILEEGVLIYILDADKLGSNRLSEMEGYIKKYCIDYSFEQMDADYESVGYEEVSEENPVFKLALEYTLTEKGLSVNMSCNSLQYNMASYHLEDISILPYLGAGNANQAGYNFFPDGSGSLFEYQQLNSIEKGQSAEIYGSDFAYHEISEGVKYQKSIRMPVYGAVSTVVTHEYYDKEGNQIQGWKTIRNGDQTVATTKDVASHSSGYVAVIEAGESLGSLESYHLGNRGPYASMRTHFNPKPKDSYKIADSISVNTNNNTWTVVSERKYTGDIRILYQMLTDPDDGKKIQTDPTDDRYNATYTYYDASWFGMAEAYRDYLISKNVLTRLGEGDVQSSIPLYVEAFGAIKTQTTVATIPVEVMTPLTTFEDVLAMYQDLSSNGISNVNFKLTGFANGGMYAVMPSKVKWESKVGGASGFRKLIQKAKEINQNDGAHLGLYPDFDFAYSQRDTATDSLNLKKDAVKTIDNRYSSKRIYSATKQTYVSFFQLAISPSRYSKFYTKLLKNYGKYDIDTMSVSSLGYALNSDFDEDDPYNREDSKKFTAKAFTAMSDRYGLMTDSANAYTWAYVDHVVNADIDSSRYDMSSTSVPFLGVVLHGYIQFAGMPLNQEGDPQYAILKSVENGAAIYFILSAQNTSELKEDPYLSQYYSIDYDIWQEDLITYYHTLNDLLYDVQTKAIINHEFLNYSDDADGYGTTRMLDVEEMKAKIEEELNTAAETAANEQREAILNETAAVAEAMIEIRSTKDRLDALLAQVEGLKLTVREKIAALDTCLTEYTSAKKDEKADKAEALEKSVTEAIKAYAQLESFCKASEASGKSRVEAEAQEILDSLTSNLTIIHDAVQKDAGRQYQETEATAIRDAVLAVYPDAAKFVTAAADALSDYENDIPDTDEDDTTPYSFLEGIEAMVKDSINKIKQDAAKEKGETVDESVDYFAELVEKAIESVSSKETADDSDDADEAKTEDITQVRNNKVVAVTYGADRNHPYKTFILNYNNYTVRTVYNGTEYTVPAGGYVVLYHN